MSRLFSNTSGLHTSRLLIRAVGQYEERQYLNINELPYNSKTLSALQEWSQQGCLLFFIILRNTHRWSQLELHVPEGTVVGFIQVLPERNRRSEISFRTQSSSRGLGYLKEASTVVFDYLFEVLQRLELLVETRTDNSAVRRLMEGLGLRGQPGSGFGGPSIVYEFGRHSWTYRHWNMERLETEARNVSKISIGWWQSKDCPARLVGRSPPQGNNGFPMFWQNDLKSMIHMLVFGAFWQAKL